MQPVGADADLGAESELEAVVEPRARVPEDRGAVDPARNRAAAPPSAVTIASLCAEPSLLMVAMASSSEATTRTATTRSRNSALKSAADAASWGTPAP
jgi:hypothetical protein